jgi:hypothetical protein
MQRFWSGLALVCVVAVLIVSAVASAQETQETQAPQGAPQPTIVIDEMRHDMGEVFEQDKYAHVFKVKNVGKANLEILSVKPG